MITQYGTPENADHDLDTGATVMTKTPDATYDMKCQGYLKVGDGVKDLDGTGGDFELTIAVGGQTLEPDPQIIEFSTAVRTGVLTNEFGVLAGEEVTFDLKSPNAADTDVDVIAILWNVSVSDVVSVNGSVLPAQRGIFDGGCVWVDDGGTAGTTYPTGAAWQPTNNIADGKTIADAAGIDHIHVHGDLTLAAAMEHYTFISDGHLEFAGWVDCDGNSVEHSTFQGVVVTGATGNATGALNTTHYTDCALWAHTNINGVCVDGALFGACSILDGGTAVFVDTVFGGLAACTLTLQAPADCALLNMKGTVTLASMDGGVCSVAMENGATVIIAASCTAGAITLSGDGNIADSSGAGCTVTIIKPVANTQQVSGTAQTANDNGADLNTLITQVGTAGDGLTNISLPNQTMDIVGNITGNLSGSVGSVSGAVGSVTEAVETDAASRTASKADVSVLGTAAGQAALSVEHGAINTNVDAVDTSVGNLNNLSAAQAEAAADAALATYGGPTNAQMEARTLVAAAYATLAGQAALAAEHAEMLTDLGEILGAVAGKKVINAAGTRVAFYDASDDLLVTLDRTGDDPGPYTWTPTWV